jgi:hypothetical protein
MRRTSGLKRVLWRVTALLQLLVPLVVSVADAKLDREAMSARAYSHVEATTGKDCVPVHPSGCALCQHITTPLTKADKPAPPLCDPRAEMPAVAFWVPRVLAFEHRPTLPRAPPAF